MAWMMLFTKCFESELIGFDLFDHIVTRLALWYFFGGSK